MARCARHDLAYRPDGTCVLCARDGGSTSSRAPVIAALAAVGGVAIAGFLYTQRPRLQPIAAIPSETAVPGPVAAATTGVPAAATTPYRDLPPAETMYAPTQVAAIPAAPTHVAAAPAGPDPVALQNAARNVSIVMYTTTWCPQCKKAKAWLNENNYSFVEHDIDASESAHEACKKLNPKVSIPTIDIDGEVIVGYGPAHMRAAIDNAARRRLTK